MRRTPQEWIDIIEKVSPEVGTMSIVDLAAKYDVNCEILRTKLRQAGFTECKVQDHSTRILDIPEPKASELIESYLSGMSLVNVSSIYNVSYNQIEKLFRARKIVSRTQKEASSLFISQRSPELIQQAGIKNGLAHAGTHKSEDELVQRALKRARKVGIGEDDLVNAFQNAGFTVDTQVPCHKYSLDLVINQSVIEIESGGIFPGHLKSDDYQHRLKCIFEQYDRLIFLTFRTFENFLRDIPSVIKKVEDNNLPRIVKLHSREKDLLILDYSFTFDS